MQSASTEPERISDARSASSRVLFTGGLVADTQRRALVRADVLVEDERITQVLAGAESRNGTVPYEPSSAPFKNGIQ